MTINDVTSDIDCMIRMLEIAKRELRYATEYKKEEEKHEDKWYFYSQNRTPNPTLVRENLRSVARMCKITADNVVKTPYKNEWIK